MPRIASTEVILLKSLSPEERGELTDALYAVHQQIFDGVERESSRSTSSSPRPSTPGSRCTRTRRERSSATSRCTSSSGSWAGSPRRCSGRGGLAARVPGWQRQHALRAVAGAALHAAEPGPAGVLPGPGWCTRPATRCSPSTSAQVWPRRAQTPAELLAFMDSWPASSAWSRWSRRNRWCARWAGRRARRRRSASTGSTATSPRPASSSRPTRATRRGTGW